MSEYKIYKTHVALFWWSNDDLKGPANVSVAIPIKKWFENYVVVQRLGIDTGIDLRTAVCAPPAEIN